MTHDHEEQRLPELFTAEQWQSLAVATGLSRRQKEIARWICRGLSKGEIAKELSISMDTVRTHMRALFKTLNIHDRVGVPVRLVLAARDLPGEKPVVEASELTRTCELNRSSGFDNLRKSQMHTEKQEGL